MPESAAGLETEAAPETTPDLELMKARGIRSVTAEAKRLIVTIF